MWALVSTQLFLILLFSVFGWAIRKKEAYWLISGLASRSEEEKQQLIANGFPQKVGALLIATAGGMLILLPLLFTQFKYAMEVQFGFMLVFLLGGLIYLSKYEVPKKRKRSYLISTVLFVGVLGTLIFLSMSSYQGYELIIKKDSFEITGIYGNEWAIEDIKRIELMEGMPEITWKQNGVGLPTLAKGRFKVKDYGSSLLFIQKDSSPYIYIELKNRKIFVNDKDPELTRAWFMQLNEKVHLVK
ncbi:DUF3784 domain-containing protein [Bacillus sp. FJAT-29790]|uniref:DUF3784 domain-containing protein n=1 Tax=Bacillus sp. FJAT-29790 TaxID=1895002 RepID=UPI001C21798F|nr:DUF3784 domain-containing protein [Bacillus sp. FJAT-29790]MBU8880453.1 DUF3784 domain-containing protein [Bacillus sp. FJAT-29790]